MDVVDISKWEESSIVIPNSQDNTDTKHESKTPSSWLIYKPWWCKKIIIDKLIALEHQTAPGLMYVLLKSLRID